MDDLMSVKEVADYARVHTESVLRWIRAGKLKAGRAGKEYRVSRGDLHAFMGLPRPTGRPPGRGPKKRV